MYLHRGSISKKFQEIHLLLHSHTLCWVNRSIKGPLLGGGKGKKTSQILLPQTSSKSEYRICPVQNCYVGVIYNFKGRIYVTFHTIVKRPQKVSLDSSKGRLDCLKCKPYTYVRYVLLFAASQVLKVT